MKFRFLLLGLSLYGLAFAQSVDNQQKAVQWVEAWEQEAEQGLETHFANLQTSDLIYTREVIDEQGKVSIETSKLSVDYENNLLYSETVDLQGRVDTVVVTPEVACTAFEGEVESLSEEERQPYELLLSDPLQALEQAVPPGTTITNVQYRGDFAVKGLIEGERVDLTYGDLSLSYIFNSDGTVIGSLDSDDARELLTVNRNQSEGSLAAQSALNHDEYALGDGEPKLVERSRTTRYVINEELEGNLFQCPAETQ